MLMLFSASAFADDYFIGGIGGVKESIKASSFGTSATTSGLVFEVAVGRKYSENLAVEVDYMDFGSMDTFAGGTASGYSVGIHALPSATWCRNCDGNDWSVFGKLGIADTFSKITPASGFSLSVKSSQSKIAPAFGFGLQITNSDSKSRISRISFDRRTSGDSVMSEAFSAITLSAGATF
jgi:hypothetical protein